MKILLVAVVGVLLIILSQVLKEREMYEFHKKLQQKIKEGNGSKDG